MPLSFTILAWLGTAVFAFSGSLMGLNKRMDIIGVAFVATLTGIGGGTIRDLLIGRTPVTWVTTPTDIFICFAVAAMACLFYRLFMGRTMKWLIYADAIGLALFSVLGTAIALKTGSHPVIAVLFGAMSATFGGIVRDVICSETPILFSKEIYISAALLGGALYLLTPESLGFEIRALVGMTGAAALRIASLVFSWSLNFPSYKNAPDKAQPEYIMEDTDQ